MQRRPAPGWTATSGFRCAWTAKRIGEVWKHELRDALRDAGPEALTELTALLAGDRGEES